MSSLRREACAQWRVELGKFTSGEGASQEFLHHYDSCTMCIDAFTDEFERVAKALDPVMVRMQPFRRQRA